MKYLTLFFLFFILILPNSNAQVQNYEEGEVVADFTVIDIDGVEHNLYTYTAAGKYVFIDFFYANCGGCQILTPVFNEFYDKYSCNSGDIICIAMNRGVDNDEAVVEFEEEFGGDFHHAPAISRNGGAIGVDEDLNPYAYPTVCVIAPDNTLLINRVYPASTVADLEAAFPEGFMPIEANCTLNVIEESLALNFDVFPNPVTSNNFFIQIENSSEAKVTIFSLLGSKMITTIIQQNNTTIFHHLESGTYFLQVETDEGSSVRKLIIDY